MTRVGVIGPMDADSFADNIAHCLPDVGVEVVILGTTTPHWGSRVRRAGHQLIAQVKPKWEGRLQRVLAERAIDAGCDLVITTQSSLLPETVRGMRDAGIAVALWFPDHIANLGRALMYIAPYSRVYFKDPLIAERAATVQGIPAGYLPEAFNPHWHRPIGGRPGDDAGLVVAGNMYPTRAVLLERLLNDGVPLRLFGGHMSTWIPQHDRLMQLHSGRQVLREEKAKTFRRAQGVLNNLHPAELDGVNCRTFEAAGCGAVVLTEFRPALPALFDPDVEVLAFSTYDELLSHWKRLDDDPDLGRRMGDAAAARALAEHTYQHRLTQILEDCA